jgi:hypothetical protein
MVTKSKSDQAAANSAPSKGGLSLEDTVAQKMRGVAPRAKSGLSGYNPYDMAPTSANSPAVGQKPTDLRKLSEWIRLTRQVAALKKDKPE